MSPPPNPRSRRTTYLAVGAVVAVLVLVAAVIVVVARRDDGARIPTAGPAPSGPIRWGPQTDLQLMGLVKPDGLAVTPAGAVYVVCCKQPPRAELWIDEPGAAFPTRQSLPTPTGGIAVDRDGNLYLADSSTISKLSVGAAPRGSDARTTLPFPDPDVPMGIAVDGAGAVNVLHWKFVDVDKAKTAAEIWKLDPGAQVPVVTPLEGVRLALAIAVDQDGTVYVADGAGRRVLRFAPGNDQPTSLRVPEGTPNALAVDAEGAVYVASAPVVSDGMVFRFPVGGGDAEKLPLRGARWTPGSTVGLGVDGNGTVYLADHDHDRVVKIPRESG